MNFSTENLSARLSRLPLLSALAATILGILSSSHVAFPSWVLVVGFLLSLLCGWRWYRTPWGGAYIFVAITLLAALSAELHRPEQPFRGHLWCDIEVEEVTSQEPDRMSGYGHVVATYRDSVASPCRLAVRISTDSTLCLTAGTRLRALCKIYPYSLTDSLSFRRYMARRGFVGGVWLNRESVTRCDTLSTIGYNLRNEALQRLADLGLSSDAMATAAAVTLGRREMLPKPTKEDYRRSGGAHLLAVSGLHVGFVYIVVGALLGFLLLVRNGQLWRSLLIVALMWIYVAVVGFSPSVVRAAVMFSIMQVVVALSSSPLSLNTLAAAATLILWFSPSMLWDAGFALSCLAVAAIVAWGVPLISRLKTALAQGAESHSSLWRGAVNYPVEWILSASVVSLVASVATMPLVATLFGLTSLWGILSGPVMVALCGVAVGATLLWIIFPIGLLAPIFGWIIESVTSAMNFVAAWCAGHEALIFEGNISAGVCCAIYLLYIVATLAFWSRVRQ